MALAGALSGLRSAVLANVRIGSSRTQQTVGKAACLTLLRGFAEGTYLDKGQVTERILDVVKNFDKVEPTKVTPEARFKEDLALDSLDTVEVVMAFEEEFGIEIPDSEADKIISTQDAINFIASHPQAK